MQKRHFLSKKTSELKWYVAAAASMTDRKLTKNRFNCLPVLNLEKNSFAIKASQL
jgi:hypothetical protein